MDWQGSGVVLTSERHDLDAVHGFLRESYWARGIPREVVERSIRGSMAFSLWRGERQIGFARVISDRATFAYLADVFVVEGERGQGLARWMVERILAHPELAGLRRWLLVTLDAHRVYTAVGFSALAAPERHMEKVLVDPYG